MYESRNEKIFRGFVYGLFWGCAIIVFFIPLTGGGILITPLAWIIPIVSMILGTLGGWFDNK
jgi:hypothetical protein